MYISIYVCIHVYIYIYTPTILRRTTTSRSSLSAHVKRCAISLCPRNNAFSRISHVSASSRAAVRASSSFCAHLHVHYYIDI